MGALQVTKCGELGTMLGGYRVLGSGAYVEKTFDLIDAPAHGLVRVELDFFFLDSWDGSVNGEEARMYIDSELVWSSTSDFREHGLNYCGWSIFADRPAVPASADVLSSASNITVRLTTTLDQDPSDESWGIQNVRILVAAAPSPLPSSPP